MKCTHDITHYLLSLAPGIRSVYGKQRRLLLAMQWLNTPTDSDDIILIFSHDVYRKLVALCGLVSTKITDDVLLPRCELARRLSLASLLQLESITLRSG